MRDATPLDPVSMINVAALRAFINGQLGMSADRLKLVLVSGGRSNLTFLIDTGDTELVLRRPPLGQTPRGAHDMLREYTVLHALQGAGPAIPVVYGYSEDSDVVGAPFYVMKRVHGVVIDRPEDVAGRSAAWAERCSHVVLDELVRLHAIDPVAVGLDDFGRPDGFLRRRIARWTEQWHASAHRDLPLFDAVADRLLPAVPNAGDTTLVHGDYRLGNVMITEGPLPTVAAILDWEMSTRGDPLTDLAHLMVYWDTTCGRITHASQRIAEQEGFLRAPELAERYASASGRDLARLDFYLAFEHWRAAVIKEGIYNRVLRSEASGEGFDEVGPSVPLHLEEAWDLTGRGTFDSSVAI